MTLKRRLILNFQYLKQLYQKLRSPKAFLNNKANRGRADGEMYLANHFGDRSVKSLHHSWVLSSMSSLISAVKLMLLFRKCQITILTHSIYKILSFKSL
jgi:hypothetical protein